MERSNAIAKIEIPVICTSELEECENASQIVEVELLPPVDINNPRAVEIYNGIKDIDEKLDAITARIEELNAEIDSLTNHADGLDYAVAVASGILTGLIDSFFVGKFSLSAADEWGNKKVEEIIKKAGNNEDIKKAIKNLEKKGLASDSVMNDFGGTRKHHLNDFAHHPTLMGLIFSFITQFTSKAYGTEDKTGVFKVVEIESKKYIGKDFPQKITFGVIFWFLHMLSDMAGSTSSMSNTLSFVEGEGYKNVAAGTFTNKVGTGLPGPLLSLAKELSALPIFKNKEGVNKFAEWISKLFNEGFDFRREIGILHELGKQAIPVIINECIVRGFYFVRKLCQEIKNNNVINFKDLDKINWKKTIPFGNRTVERMMTIASGTFVAFDVADAAIRSGGFNPSCLLRLNFVGIGRFVVAIGVDVGMGIKKHQKEQEQSKALSEYIELANIKIYYRKADLACSHADMFENEAAMHNAEKEVWFELQKTTESMCQLYEVIRATGLYYTQALSAMDRSSQRMVEAIPAFDQNFPSLREKMLKRLRK